MEAENKDKMLPELRKESRRQYLQKREKGKLDELMDDIRDDEFLFDDSQLTKREKDDRKYKKKVLELATQYSKASEIEKVQRYHMPEDRKNSELQQYVEVNIYRHRGKSRIIRCQLKSDLGLRALCWCYLLWGCLC